MNPPKRRPAAPASQRRKAAAPAPEVPKVADAPPEPRRRRAPGSAPPDVPTAPPGAPVSGGLAIAPEPPVETAGGTPLLGPDGEPVAQEVPAGHAPGNSAPPTETGHVEPEDRATTQSPGRPLALYPLPVWPD